MVAPYGLNRLTDRKALIDFLGIETELFDEVLAFVPPPPVGDSARTVEGHIIVLSDLPPFLRHLIPKRNPVRGFRTVWEPYHPKPHYKALARRLDIFFGGFLPGYPHDKAFGYRPRRNILENASVHKGHRHLLSVDLENFFPSITVVDIQQLFERLSVKPEVATLLARFVTIGGTLPLGLPTSPVLSNAVVLPLDIALDALAGTVGAVYSRYSDDISFSSDDALPDLTTLTDIVAEHSFAIAREKTRTSKRGQAHYITGLSISDPKRPHVPRHRKQRLRQELYYATKFGLADHLHQSNSVEGSSFQSEVNRLDGMVKFVAYHEPDLATKLRSQWGAVLIANGARASFVPKNQHQPPFDFFIDEAEMSRGNEKLLAICMVTTQHPVHVADAARQVRLKFINDLWSDGNPQTLIDKGLHFADATQDQRLEYIRKLAVLPVNAYVAYCPYNTPAAYEQTYLRLLTTMLPRRLMAAESKFATLTFEKNSKVSQKAIKQCVEAAHAQLEQSNNRRPLRVDVEFVSKPHFGITAPDFFLGLLGLYLRSQPAAVGKPAPRDRLLFDRLRDKFRVISDLSTGADYTRRDPIMPWNP